jgi:hypothetical protein
MNGIERLASLLRGKPAEHAASWPESRGDRHRVLIENPDAADLWAHADALREAGYEVATCLGPTPAHERGPWYRRRPSRAGDPCPLLGHGSCPLVDGADVVVSTTQLTDSRKIVAALRAQRSLPVIVEGTTADLERDSDAIGDAREIEQPVTPALLLAAVDDALTQPPAPPS